MDSFAQQMLNEIDRRCKAYQLSNSLINLSEELKTNVSFFNYGKFQKTCSGFIITNATYQIAVPD